MKTSLIIGSHNEGDMLRQTIKSARETVSDFEVIVIDDASTDGSCDQKMIDADILIRHEKRAGVAQHRREGGDVATGDVLIFADAHHQFSAGNLSNIAEIALKHDAISWSCMRGWQDKPTDNKIGHGAYIAEQVDDKRGMWGMFGVAWLPRMPRDAVSRCGGMLAPYGMPLARWQALRWPIGCRNSGFTETILALKAFFSDTQVIHACGPFSRHFYREGKDQPYRADSRDMYHNLGIGCRVCFTDATWQSYLYPKVFARYFTADHFENPELLSQASEFQTKHKRRPDSEWWRGMMDRPVPAGVSDK